MDIDVLIETWLSDSDMDTIWMESNGFKKDGYQISVINRIGMKGYGLALISGKNVTIKLLLWRVGLTAQHMQDCPIFFIQLNYVHK